MLEGILVKEGDGINLDKSCSSHRFILPKRALNLIRSCPNEPCFTWGPIVDFYDARPFQY